MTRTEAIAIITNALQTVDDGTLAAAAARLEARATDGVTASDIHAAFSTNSELPRELTARELALIQQSRGDFRAGRTMSLAELEASLDARATARAGRRA